MNDNNLKSKEMRPIVTSKIMADLDHNIEPIFSLPLLLLMENAGAEVAKYARSYLESKKLISFRILVVAGPGNNGGDGFVVARQLLSTIENLKILLVILNKKDYKGDARINYEIIKKLALNNNRIKIVENSLSQIKFFNPDLIIDAIFGTGFKDKPHGIYKQVISIINSLHGYKIAIDIASGVNGDTGAVPGLAVKADLTIALGLLKRGHLLYPGKEYCGNVRIGNLGIPYENLTEFNTFLLNHNFINQILPKRKPNSHKGTYGSVGVVAGGDGYSGAACLTSLGALSVGAGLVRLCYPIIINSAVEKKLIEVIKVPLPATKQGTLAIAGLNTIKAIIRQSTVLAIGPGVTTNSETKDLIQKIVRICNIPMVIDADGLNNLTIQDLLKIPKRQRQKIVLTPHPKEFSRLFGIPVKDVNQNRIDIVQKWAKELKVTIVLKGAPTIISSPKGIAYINPCGNSGLAKGGTGDVLTGMIAGFIAQGAPPVLSACIGVYLHGLAADLKVKTKTEYCLTASDVLAYVPKAIQNITNTPLIC